MIQICGLNFLSEAMLYFLGKANNNSVKKRISEAIQQYPEYKKEFEAVAKPAKALERQLDKELSADEAVVNKFFRFYDGAGVNHQFGFCLALIMLKFQIMQNLNQPLDVIVKNLRECPENKVIYSFCFVIADKNDAAREEDCTKEKLLMYLDKLQISAEDKLQIITAAFAYKKSLDELLSIMLPAAKIIEASHEKYDEIINRFASRYSGSDARALISSCFADKLPYFENIAVVPSLFGFDYHYALFDFDKLENLYNYHTEEKTPSGEIRPADGNAESRFNFAYILIGVLKHLIITPEKDDTYMICDKIKAISDTTRLDMLFYLCSHKPYAQELGEKFGLSHSAVSYHINKLLAAGYVTSELSGGKTYYEADKENIQRMLYDFGSRIK